MKHFIFILLLFFSNLAKAQQNLVPNPSFEDTLVCPLGLDQLDAAVGWSSYRASPDYYNACNLNSLNVPNANFGYQYAHSGSAMIGLDTYHKGQSPVGNDYREFAGVELLAPLQIGTKYYFSFYAVVAERYTGFASNNLGLKFFTNSYSLTNPAPLDNYAHLKFDSILTDSVTWSRVSGSFLADSAYQYLCIGNFYDYLNTDTLYITNFKTIAYYYVDDVCVSSDSLFNEVWTGIKDIELDKVYIYPNPVQNYLQFKSNQQVEEIKIYDNNGRLIKSEIIKLMEGRINCEMIEKGIYFASFRKEKTISVYKFLKL